MTREKAKTFFIQKYQGAHHVQVYFKYEVILREGMQLYPPRCLENFMDEVCDFVQDEHNAILGGREYLGMTEYRNSAMDYDGIDPERV